MHKNKKLIQNRFSLINGKHYIVNLKKEGDYFK
jgi:hypothetical protein